MARKPHVVVSMESPAERSLLAFYLSSSQAPNRATELPAGHSYAGASPQLVISDQRADESRGASVTRLHAKFPKAAIVLVVDAAGPVRAERADAGLDEVLDGVLVRPLTIERLDAVLSPIIRRVSRPEHPRVLVVDDDPEVLHFVEQVLEKAGCEVTSVSDPQRYLARPKTVNFDLALLDVVMPEVDGLQICLRLRAAGCDDLRICMMSAADDPETERKADLYGADEFLPKPLHVRELHALIGRVRTHAPRKLGEPQLRAVEAASARREDAREESDLFDR